MTNAFVTTIIGAERRLGWNELNRLKKDILWNYDENGKELWNSYLPHGSFDLPYWEYLNLDGSDALSIEETSFYRVGALILLLSKVAEYIDIPGGNQKNFGTIAIPDLDWYVQSFNPGDPMQSKLKEIAILGLSIAKSISRNDIVSNDVYEHKSISGFVDQLHWVEKNFVLAYYHSRLAADSTRNV